MTNQKHRRLIRGTLCGSGITLVRYAQSKKNESQKLGNSNNLKDLHCF